MTNDSLMKVESMVSKICVKQPLKIDKTKILMTNGSLMKVESIAECSPWSSLPLNHSRRVVVSYKQKYVHEVLVNCLFKLAHEKSVVR